MAAKRVSELPLLGEMPSNWRVVDFGDVLDGGTRNGIYKPKAYHGRGVKIVNMGELFAYPRLRAVELRRVELSDDELARSDLRPGDLLFARRSLVAEGAGKCSVVLETDEPEIVRFG
jgi:type I restriction enzyme S subunit